jgi:GDP/UDP-N,N'-diacetylbacillosamine 2-epimerase (hydrolysing)
MIDNYTKKNPKRSVSFISMGQLRYLSTLQYMDAMVGNSSSGLIEAPSFKIGTINIGDRQKGRIKASSVIDCDPKKNLITSAFTKLYSKDFIRNLQNSINLYGDGHSSQKIIDKIKMTDLKTILKKSFYDLKFVQKENENKNNS